jgi:signal transduction histidine kinase/ligand-binding sensor domain-containing protein
MPFVHRSAFTPTAAYICVTLFVLMSATTAPAQSERALLTDYRMTAWTGGDGITLGSVRSLAQDDRGYIWLASDAGLVRFDGFTFSATDFLNSATGLPQTPARVVYVARDKSLWVGYINGAGVYHLVGDAVRDKHLQDRPTRTVSAIAEDHSGAMWVGCDDGVYELTGETWTRVPLPFVSTDHRVSAIYEDRRGKMWVAAGSALYSRTSHGEFRKEPGITDVVRSIVEDAQGAIWVTDAERGFKRVGGDRNRLFDAAGNAVLSDREGSLWVASFGEGIWRVRTPGSPTRGDVARATVENGLLSDEIASLLEDRDGNIWAGSRTGLHLFTRHKVLALTGMGIVTTIAVQDNGDAWAGTSSGLVALRHVTPVSVGERRLVSSEPIRALHVGGTGAVWVATASGLGTLAGDRLVPPSGARATVRAITSIDSDRSTLWVCDEERGLLRLSGRDLESITAIPLGDERPSLVKLDDAGRAWVAMRSGRIAIVERDRVELLGPGQGLPKSTIHTIVQDKTGTIFVGTDAGLSVFRGGTFHTASSPQGLPTAPALAALTDDAGDLWVAFRDVGVVHIGARDFERASRDLSFRLPASHIYSTSDGTAGPPFDSHAASRAPDGSLWFVTRGGVTIFDPGALAASGAVPSSGARVEELVVGDGHAYHAKGSALAAGTNRIRIDFGSTSPDAFDLPRFRYRLDGVDSTWIDASGRRQAVYTNLAPGSYRFLVQAAEGPGAWPVAAVEWPFSIEPKFYQTRWFYCASAAALLFVGMSGWRLRSRALRRKLEAVYAERLRIAREIHDTLLQSLVGATLQLDAAFHEVPEQQSRTRAALLAMRRQIEGYIVEARRSIWDLRSPSLEIHDLVSAMRASAERLTKGKVALSLAITGVPRRCPANIETQALRIAEEAIANAVRHGSITRVDITLAFDDESLRLQISDDGRGFDTEQAMTWHVKGHYGLVTMRERAIEAGGRLFIDSTVGSGTQITAEFPLTA